MRLVKRAMLRTLLLPGAGLPLRPLMRRRATIFMLHRFRDDAHGVYGTDPATLRTALDWLRRHRYPIVSLKQLFDALAGGEVPSRGVAFTIDDGYLDQATVAGPVFAEFDCPVTVFLTTGFLDRALWFWWDKIEFVFGSAGRPRLAVELGGDTISYAWASAAERYRAMDDFTDRCKRVPDVEKHAAIRRLAKAASVDLPEAPPARYLPMSWEQARTAERRGMTFGPHTVTHPILTRTPDDQARAEIGDSWRRLKEELVRPDPVFCYPNGGPADFGPREIAACRSARLVGAVMGTPGYADPWRFGQTADGPYRVERFAMPDELPQMVQYASGLERLKQILRKGDA